MIPEPCAPASVYNGLFAMIGIVIPNVTAIIIAAMGLRQSRDNGRVLRNGGKNKASPDYESWLNQLEDARQKKSRGE